MLINFATKETLRQPTGGLVVESQQEQDHVLGGIGAVVAGPDFDVLVSDGQWHNYLPESELQRNRFGDTFMCVSFSNNNIHEILMNKVYQESLNMSDLFLGKGSGTVRGQGNGKRAVAEWKRLNGYILESEYPYTPNTTLDQAYAPLSQELLRKGMKSLESIQFFYKWLPSNSVKDLKEGLKYSPLQVDVLGVYKMNEKGYLVWDIDNPQYAHEVAIIGYEEGECWHVFDSETSQFIRFVWDYPFGSPMIHSLKKKMKIQLFKEKGNPAIAVKHAGEDSLIAFSGGSVSGDNLFKSIYGVKDFNQIPITEVDKFPYPIKHLINTNLI